MKSHVAVYRRINAEWHKTNQASSELCHCFDSTYDESKEWQEKKGREKRATAMLWPSKNKKAISAHSGETTRKILFSPFFCFHGLKMTFGPTHTLTLITKKRHSASWQNKPGKQKLEGLRQNYQAEWQKSGMKEKVHSALNTASDRSQNKG